MKTKRKELPMATETTLPVEYNRFHRCLYLAFERGEAYWKLAFTIGFGQAPRIGQIKARDRKALENEIQGAKKRFGLADDTAVLSCYEAGRAGFWLH
jgi:transposase